VANVVNATVAKRMSQQQATRLGLTGGIGSGKSTVANMFTKLGAAVIDADAISKNLTASHGAAIEAIKLYFGEAMISADRSLDRNRMRELIFTDANAKKHLENIIHPLIKLEMQRQDHSAMASGLKLMVYDIPLLVESPNWRPILDQVLVIDCLEQTQINRVMIRNTLKQEDVEKIIANQASRKIRNSAADIVIFNDSITVEQLLEQVKQVAQRLERSFDERKKL
jgi:dephospho-CoA kinase